MKITATKRKTPSVLKKFVGISEQGRHLESDIFVYLILSIVEHKEHNGPVNPNEHNEFGPPLIFIKLKNFRKNIFTCNFLHSFHKSKFFPIYY